MIIDIAYKQLQILMGLVSLLLLTIDITIIKLVNKTSMPKI